MPFWDRRFKELASFPQVLNTHAAGWLACVVLPLDFAKLLCAACGQVPKVVTGCVQASSPACGAIPCVQVLVTPHTAFLTNEALDAIAATTIDNLMQARGRVWFTNLCACVSVCVCGRGRVR